MKNGLIVFIFLVLTGSTGVAQAQYSIYAEGGSIRLKNGPKGDFLYGGQAGVLVKGTRFRADRLLLSADVQTRIYQKDGESYQGIVVGPRLAMSLDYKRIPRLMRGLKPYAEFNFGFANYNPGAGGSTTESQFGGEAGVSRRIYKSLDAVLSYSYSRYEYNFGFYHPQSLGIGLICHFSSGGKK